MTALPQSADEVVDLLEHELSEVVHLAEIEQLAHEPPALCMLFSIPFQRIVSGSPAYLLVGLT